MLLSLAITDPFMEDARQDVRAEFGFYHGAYADGSPRPHTVVTVYRQHKFISPHEEVVELNWSAWGSQSLDVTARVAAVLTEATEFARQLAPGGYTEHQLYRLQRAQLSDAAEAAMQRLSEK